MAMLALNEVFGRVCSHERKGRQSLERKLDWIAEKGGMALLITHPDYMSFDDKKPGNGTYPAKLYSDFLRYARERYGDQYWKDLARDIARYWPAAIPGGEKVSRPSLNVELIDPLQDKRWDAFVGHHPFGWICHLSGWKEVVEIKLQPHAGALIWRVVDQAGQIKADCPCLKCEAG